jgi:hypothetical protein
MNLIWGADVGESICNYCDNLLFVSKVIYKQTKMIFSVRLLVMVCAIQRS